MGHRLSKIYTRTGDGGDTGLADGSRIGKDDPRIEAIGEIDGVNALIGFVLAVEPASEISDTLVKAQHLLFDLGGELAIPGAVVMLEEDVAWLESALDGLNERLPPLKEFVLPGGNELAARLHMARSAARSAERRLVTLAAEQAVNPQTLSWVNRLSDHLFVAARYACVANEVPEVLWQRRDQR